MDFVPLGLEDDDASEKIEIQSTFVISISAMSNNRLSLGENLVRALTWKSYNGKQNIVDMRRNCSSWAVSPLFQNIFSTSLTLGVKLHTSFVLFDLFFSSVLQFWYVKVRISRSVSESPFDFEITRVDYILNLRWLEQWWLIYHGHFEPFLESLENFHNYRY